MRPSAEISAEPFFFFVSFRQLNKDICNCPSIIRRSRIRYIEGNKFDTTICTSAITRGVLNFPKVKRSHCLFDSALQLVAWCSTIILIGKEALFFIEHRLDNVVITPLHYILAGSAGPFRNLRLFLLLVPPFPNVAQTLLSSGLTCFNKGYCTIMGWAVLGLAKITRDTDDTDVTTLPPTGLRVRPPFV
jgi:hypothetical protein